MYKIIFNISIVIIILFTTNYCIIEAKNNEIQKLNQSVISSQKIIELEEMYNKTDEITAVNDSISLCNDEVINDNIKLEAFNNGTINTVTEEIINVKEEVADSVNNTEDISEYNYIQVIDGATTDVTDDQIRYACKKMRENGLNPHLLFSIFYIESRGQIKVNNALNCRGYGQIIPDTGKYIYEVYLSNGPNTYNHNMAYNPYTNIDLSVGLLSCLMKKYNGDIHKVLYSYSGGITNYDTKVSRLFPDGLSMQNIEDQYKKFYNLN